jgi:KUP system potassium uptake protein
MTRQAIQLGWLPRLRITQTSEEGYGQIYVGAVNWLLMLATLALTIGFGKSDNLASAYGIAVSATMLMTSALLMIAMREVLGWPLIVSVIVAGAFLVVDGAFFMSNSLKVASGGYVPLALGAAVYTVMYVWHRGVRAVSERLHESLVPFETFLDELRKNKTARVPGTAVFLTRAKRDTPPVMVWHVKHNRALHEHVIAISTTTEPIPRIPDSERMTFTELAPGFWRADVRYGFMERPNVPRLLVQLKRLGCTVDLTDVTYYVGHETITGRNDGQGIARWQRVLFTFMVRNAARVTDYF